MSPLLIDSRDLLKLAMVSVFTGLLVFAAGFASGYRHAGQQKLLATESLPLPLPELAGADVAREQAPAVIAPGADIDVDLPDNVALQVVETEQTPVTPPLPATVPEAYSEAHPDAQPESSTEISVNTVPEAVPAVAVITDTGASPPAQARVIAAPVAEKHYSVQVGTYSRLENAQNMVRDLQQRRFAAYITDYRNRKQQLRYNVRFGEYPSRKAARGELRRYQAEAGQDGYIVRYSQKNRGRLAGAETGVSAGEPVAATAGALSRMEPEIPVRHEIN